MADRYNQLEKLSLVVFGLLLGLFNTPLLVSMWWAGWIGTPEIIMLTIVDPILVLVTFILLRLWMWTLRRKDPKRGL